MVGFIIARIIVIVLLFWALDKHPYGYYTFLRFVVCGVTAYGAWFSAEIEKQGWAWCLGIIAVLFNPIIPIYLNKEIWAPIDIGVAIILIVSLFLLRKTEVKETEDEKVKK
jgi:hypothetical protein